MDAVYLGMLGLFFAATWLLARLLEHLAEA